MIRAVVLTSLLLLAAARSLPAQLPIPPVSAEIRAGVAVPTGEFAEAEPGIGAESGPMVGAALVVHFTSRLALVGGYSLGWFGCPRCAQQGLEQTVMDQGADIALHLESPAWRGMIPWARAGGLLHHITFAGAGGELSSDFAPGYQAGAGVRLSLPGALQLTPGFHYRGFPAELDLGGLGGESVDVSHVLFDVGLSYRF